MRRIVKFLKYLLFYKIFFKRCGYMPFIISPIRISYKNITIGNRVIILNNARIEAVRRYNNNYFDPSIIISDGVSIQQNVHLTCANSVFIGKNTAIASNVTITDIIHPYQDVNKPIEHHDIITIPVTIGDDCKIYNNSVILPGTTIGKHCVIGANSVVSGKIPDYCVVVGSPARIVKSYDSLSGEWIVISK